MDIKFLLFFTSVTFFFGCADLPNKIDETDVITYDTTFEKNGDTANFSIITSNGKLVSSWQEVDGEKYGSYKEFYENGAIKTKGKYIRGNKIGTFLNYYKSGILSSEIEYLPNYDVDKQKVIRSEANTVVFFDEKGEIIKDKSNFYQLEYDTNVLSLGEVLNLKIHYDYRFGGDTVFFENRPYTLPFYTYSSVDEDVVEVYHFDQNRVIELNIKADKLGKNHFLGAIKDADKKTMKGRVIYVRFDYFVTEPK